MPLLYILSSPKLQKFYVGSTSNLDRRFSEHQRGQTKSTKNGIPWVIAFTQICPNIQIAKRLETKLKRMRNKTYIIRLIQGEFILA